MLGTKIGDGGMLIVASHKTHRGQGLAHHYVVATSIRLRNQSLPELRVTQGSRAQRKAAPFYQLSIPHHTSHIPHARICGWMGRTGLEGCVDVWQPTRARRLMAGSCHPSSIHSAKYDDLISPSCQGQGSAFRSNPLPNLCFCDLRHPKLPLCALCWLWRFRGGFPSYPPRTRCFGLPSSDPFAGLIVVHVIDACLHHPDASGIRTGREGRRTTLGGSKRFCVFVLRHGRVNRG
jgi:hypothetical protein